MSDRKLGYIIIALALCAGLGAVSYIAYLGKTPVEIRTLRFNQIGSLAVEDAVRMNGTLVGSVREFIIDDDNRVLVHIHSRKPIPIRTSSRASVKVRGVMGERFIEISLGDQNDPLVPKEQIFDGIFELGPSEAIAYIDLLEEKIIQLKGIMLLFARGSETKRSFADDFGDVVIFIDSLVSTLTVGLAGIEAGLNHGLEQAADLAAKTIEFTAAVSAKAPEVISDIDTLLVKIDNLMPKVEKFVTQVETITASIDGNQFLWGDGAELDKIRELLANLREFTNSMREDGLALPVKLKIW
ncbi:MAG: MlaD family protein [Chitinispirillia bacterium]|nr:MlaD family protein [Chitinispirillia bacterium]